MLEERIQFNFLVWLYNDQKRQMAEANYQQTLRFNETSYEYFYLVVEILQESFLLEELVGIENGFFRRFV